MLGIAGDKYYYHSNDLYCVAALTDANGNCVERMRYDPYGKCTTLAPDGVTPRAASAVGNPWTFTSRRLDAETGLMYYRARMYSLDSGRFISRDPIGYLGSKWLLYGYVDGRPTRWGDPLGLGGNSAVGQQVAINFAVDFSDQIGEKLADSECFDYGKEERELKNSVIKELENASATLIQLGLTVGLAPAQAYGGIPGIAADVVQGGYDVAQGTLSDGTEGAITSGAGVILGVGSSVGGELDIESEAVESLIEVAGAVGDAVSEPGRPDYSGSQSNNKKSKNCTSTSNVYWSGSSQANSGAWELHFSLSCKCCVGGQWKTKGVIAVWRGTFTISGAVVNAVRNGAPSINVRCCGE